MGADDRFYLKAVATSAAEPLSGLGLIWGGGCFWKTLALVISLVRHVLNGCELAQPEHDVSFPSFPERLAIWEGVSDYVVWQLMLSQVGLPSWACPGNPSSASSVPEG